MAVNDNGKPFDPRGSIAAITAASRAAKIKALELRQQAILLAMVGVVCAMAAIAFNHWQVPALIFLCWAGMTLFAWMGMANRDLKVLKAQAQIDLHSRHT